MVFSEQKVKHTFILNGHSEVLEASNGRFLMTEQ